MCIIIDTNTLALVFNQSSKLHIEFKPVLMWITHGKGKVVYGGTKYSSELQKATKYFSIINLLKDAGKVCKIDDVIVDREQTIVEYLNPKKSFNDPHIPAIVRVSGCKLICSNDKASYSSLKYKYFYPKQVSIPKIYSGRRNKDLLCSKNIAKICK